MLDVSHNFPGSQYSYDFRSEGGLLKKSSQNINIVMPRRQVIVIYVVIGDSCPI